MLFGGGRASDKERKRRGEQEEMGKGALIRRSRILNEESSRPKAVHPIKVENLNSSNTRREAKGRHTFHEFLKSDVLSEFLFLVS